jgi:hypothetical protein
MTSTSEPNIEAQQDACNSRDSVQFLPVVLHQDGRGTLAAFDYGGVPFTPVRAFVISDVPAGAVRGGHALLCEEEFIWAAAGSCEVTTFSHGTKSSSILNDRRWGMYLPSGIVLELSNFVPGTLVLVLASKPFSKREG